MIITKLIKKPLTAYKIIKNEGFIAFQFRFWERIRKIRGHKHKLHSFAEQADILKADWTNIDSARFNPKPVKKKQYTINWVMSPPGKGSGGHQNLFRFIRYIELAGHINNIYLYSTRDKRTLEEIQDVLDDSYPQVNARINWLKTDVSPADAMFATGWETAYPVFTSKITAKRFYFVQDFEPYFYPVGSESVLAENSYHFGFHGITAGGWLSHKLHSEYGMRTDHYDFGADTRIYKFENGGQRKEVFFYARPVTARRGFELGIMALSEFNKQHPDYIINLAGWDVSDYEIPFPYVNLMSLPLKDLSAVYNRCAVGLVISLTNMSLLPLELLACGTIPVMNDAPNNRMVSNNKYIAYTPNNPRALANKMSEIVSMNNLSKYAHDASNSVQGNSWDTSGESFVKIVEETLSNG
jgi:glycosyltransferase involved in cell wall biosynthesis